MKSNAKNSGQTKSADRSRGSSNKPAFGKYAAYKAVKELNAKRKKAKLSLQEIADAVDRKRHAVWKWLNGLSRPEVPIRLKIQSAYEIPTTWWLTKPEQRTLQARLGMLQTIEKTRGKLTKEQMKKKRALMAELGID